MFTLHKKEKQARKRRGQTNLTTKWFPNKRTG